MSRFRPHYQDDSDFTTNAESYYKDLGRKAKLIELLAKKIYDYNETLTISLQEIQEELDHYVEIVDDKISLIDHKIGEGFNQEINTLLVDWVADGTLDHIINETIFSWKVDQTEFDESMDSVLSDLAQKATKQELNTEKGRIDNLVAHAGDTDGNAELLDIRIGWDGVTYPTAGDAVRSIQQFMTETNEIWEV